ncbi:MAG: hypothetical protein M3336_02490, partial [Chloroflexota bacterium]|nr:hypothetical protein [Chloroflexota bacterium]
IDPSAISTVAALATAFVAPSLATPTAPSPTATPRSPVALQPTSSPSPSPTDSAPSPAPSARTLLDERFGDNQRGWPDNASSTAWLADGVYHLFPRTPGRFVAVGAPLAPLGDVTVSGSFRKVGGPAGGGYGLIIRDQAPGTRDGLNQEGQFVVLAVGDRGEFGIWRRDGSRWLDLIPWTATELVRTGLEPNDLVVRVSGTRLGFLVNGRLLAEVAEATLLRGGVGIFVGGDLNHVVLERFTVQVPE